MPAPPTNAGAMNRRTAVATRLGAGQHRTQDQHQPDDGEVDAEVAEQLGSDLPDGVGDPEFSFFFTTLSMRMSPPNRKPAVTSSPTMKIEIPTARVASRRQP